MMQRAAEGGKLSSLVTAAQRRAVERSLALMVGTDPALPIPVEIGR